MTPIIGSFALILLERATASILKSSGILAVGTTLIRMGTAAKAPVTKAAFFNKDEIFSLACVKLKPIRLTPTIGGK